MQLLFDRTLWECRVVLYNLEQWLLIRSDLMVNFWTAVPFHSQIFVSYSVFKGEFI